MTTNDPGISALNDVLVAVAAAVCPEAAVSVAPDDEGGLVARIDGTDADRLIGRGGETIDAIQYLAAQIVSRAADGTRRRVTIDADGYRARRAAALEELAMRAADEAVTHGEEIELDAMTPHDRRIVHMALKERTDITTRSEGEEPRRRIIVEPAE
jgi:spoIIIJ-associated protein